MATSDHLTGQLASGNPAARLRLRVTAAAESILRGGHPWLFAESIQAQNRAGQLGELAVVYDRKDRFLAVGLYDPDSPIRVRVLHAGKPQSLDAGWWRGRLEEALARRRGLFDARTTGYRCINGESDGWPGLVLDRYDTTLVLKLYTAVWLPRLEEIAGIVFQELRNEAEAPDRDRPRPRSRPRPRNFEESRIEDEDSRERQKPENAITPKPAEAGAPGPERLVLRLSRNLLELAETRFGRKDGEVLLGMPLTGPVIFLESGLRFEAEALLGQKTGFFLDQRENRRQVESLARGRTVLNAFSFSGGFSLYAARGGADSVTDLDLSPHALAAAERNFELNRGEPNVAACRHELVQAEAFEWLAGNARRRFDLVVLDPPSLAKREAERAGAIRAYGRLAELGVKRLSPGGILLACSCSAHVSAEEFFQAVRRAATRSGRRFEELLTTRHAPDHPATFKEGEYLKGIYVRMVG